MVLGKLDSYMYKNETRTFSNTTHKKINSKWINDLNVNDLRLHTVKLLKENIGRTFFNINFCIHLLEKIKTKINK